MSEATPLARATVTLLECEPTNPLSVMQIGEQVVYLPGDRTGIMTISLALASSHFYVTLQMLDGALEARTFVLMAGVEHG